MWIREMQFTEKRMVYGRLFVSVIRGRWALNVGLDVSFDNLQDSKGLLEKTGEALNKNYDSSR
jgi:hypothetical protein